MRKVRCVDLCTVIAVCVGVSAVTALTVCVANACKSRGKTETLCECVFPADEP